MILEDVFSHGLYTFAIITVLVTIAACVLRLIVKKVLIHLGQKQGKNYGFLASMINAVIMIVALYGIVMQIKPLQSLAVSLLASSGVVAVVLSFASQDAMSNIGGGIIVSIFKPFNVGDVVKFNDIIGTVEAIALRHTVIRTNQNHRLVVPNSIVNSSIIENITMSEARECNQLEIDVGYSVDIDKAKRLITEEAVNHPNFVDTRTQEQKQAGDPPIGISCVGLGEFSVKLKAFIWTEDIQSGWKLLSDLRISILERFKKEGIEIPYPYHNVVLKQ